LACNVDFIMITLLQRVSNFQWTYQQIGAACSRRTYFQTTKRNYKKTVKGFFITISSFYWSIIEWEDLCVGLTLPPRLIFKAVNAFWISIFMALSTLPDDNFLCDFCRCSLSELLLSPAFFPHMGQTFIVGFLCCHSIETLPCSFWSNTCKIFAKPSFGCARRWTRFSVCHAFDKVYFLHSERFQFITSPAVIILRPRLNKQFNQTLITYTLII